MLESREDAHTIRPVVVLSTFVRVFRLAQLSQITSDERVWAAIFQCVGVKSKAVRVAGKVNARRVECLVFLVKEAYHALPEVSWRVQSTDTGARILSVRDISDFQFDELLGSGG